jgi:hexokinase
MTSPHASRIEFHSSDSHRYKAHVHKYKLKYNINNHNKCIHHTTKIIAYIQQTLKHLVQSQNIDFKNSINHIFTFCRSSGGKGANDLRDCKK